MPNSTGQVPPHFLVIVPGYMGSTLKNRKTGKLVWVDFASIPLNPLGWAGWVDELLEQLAYPNDDIEPVSIMDEVIFVPPWAKQEHYGRLLLALQAMGYRANPARYSEQELTCYTFPYDWRQDNRRSAQLLKESITRWRSFHPGAQVWILAHSNGGLVARWYIEKLNGKDHVERVFLFGSPCDGTPRIMQMLVSGADTLFRKRFNLFSIAQRSRDLIRSFPSAYQLIPVADPFLRDANNLTIDPFLAPAWLDDPNHQQLLADGKQFTEELGNTSSVETLCFFGRERPTPTAGVVDVIAQSRWGSVNWQITNSGDGTIPERSAVHPNAEHKYPFNASHGDLYVDGPVLQFLKWELSDQYALVSKDLGSTASLIASLALGQNTYQPNEGISVHCVVTSADPAREPIQSAHITVVIEWVGALPGDNMPELIPEPPESTRLAHSNVPGHYVGEVVGPDLNGYYHVVATVQVGSETLSLQEMVIIEAD